MNILQVTNFFKPSWETGGVTKVCYELSRSLVLKGNKVTVYTTDGYNARLNIKANKPICVDGIKVYYFYNLFRSLVESINFPTPFYAFFVLKKEITYFDVIHIHEYRTLFAILVHYFAKKYSVPYIIQAHGSVLPIFQKDKLKNIFDYLFGYDILKDASKLLALTKIEAAQYLEMGIDSSKICIIPNGLDLSEFDDLPDKGRFKNKFSINDSEKIILYLGRIDKIKGIDLLIDAFSNLINEFDDARLVIVGPDSKYLPILKKQIAKSGITDKILFTGPLYGRDKIEAYVDADIYVLPSRYETFPNTVLEACACGTPVVITDRCGISDIVENNKLGYVTKFDAILLKNCLLKLVNDKNLSESIGGQSLYFVKKEFSWNKITQDLELLYQECRLLRGG